MKKLLLSRVKSDSGLMGPTHALSAITITLVATWLFSDFMFRAVLGDIDLLLYIAAMIVIVGASLMPDLDASKSTSISTLGILGEILSKIMRLLSKVVQEAIKGPYDKSADPHRGFWHTGVSAFLVGFLITSVTKFQIELFHLSFFDVTITTASLITAVIIYMSILLAFAGLFNAKYKKSNSSQTGKLVLHVGAIITALFIIANLPPYYSWVGAAVTFGWIAHLLGDMMTVSGVPILFPLKYKGKRWWNFRFPFGMKAGGSAEKVFLIPILSVTSVLVTIKILPYFF